MKIVEEQKYNKLEAEEGTSFYEYTEEPSSDTYFVKTAYLPKTITVDTIKELYSRIRDKDITYLPHPEENP